MWRRWRTILFAHSIASWVSMSALWIVQLTDSRRPTHTFDNPTFWLIFCVTEVAAPALLPLLAFAMVFSYRPGMGPILEITFSAYLVTVAITLPWLWRRQSWTIARK